MAPSRTRKGTGKRASRATPAARSSSARRKAPARARARRPRGRSAGLPALLPKGILRLPVLDQRQRDVLGLALLAAGVFMGFILYGGWDGGRAGHAVAVALGWTLGRARGLTPVALGLGGCALLLRPVLPALRPLRTGSLCVFAAVTLALAAGMLGLSSAPVRDAGSWSSAHLQSHGGVAGQALYEAAHRLVQSVGVDILAVFLLLTGVILLTGASIASASANPSNGTNSSGVKSPNAKPSSDGLTSQAKLSAVAAPRVPPRACTRYHSTIALAATLTTCTIMTVSTCGHSATNGQSTISIHWSCCAVLEV